MGLRDRYSTKAEDFIYLDSGKKEVKIPKTIITTEAYAIIDAIQDLIDKIEHVRVSR